MAKTRKRSTAGAHDLVAIDLPEPSFKRTRRLDRALRRRQTVRQFAATRLSIEALSNLLWAACGVNRVAGPFGLLGRTAASASNSQEVDLYVLLEEGAYCYDAHAHTLTPVVGGDLRRFAIGRGQRRSGDKAPVRLVFVADVEKLERSGGYREPGLLDPEIQRSYYFVDTGMIAANVYLFAAAEGLAAWFHNCDRAALQNKLGLRSDQRALFGQTVGYAIERSGA